MKSAEAFFRRSVAGKGTSWPGKINLEGNIVTHLALQELGRQDERWRSVCVRVRRYLNNVIEQDHRAIKQRCASMLGFKSFGASLKGIWDQALSRAGGPVGQDSMALPPMQQNSQKPDS